MNRRSAHLSRTALVLVAAAGTVWLSAFFLPGAVVEPIPLLPAIGSAAGKVITVPGLSKSKAAATTSRATATVAVARSQLATATFVPQLAQIRPEPRLVQRSRPAPRRRPAPRPKHVAPVPKASPTPAPASTASAPVFDSAAPPGRAVGWHRKHDAPTAPATPVPVPVPVPVHGNGNGNGHAKHDAPAVQPAPPPAAPIAPVTPPSPPDGHDNGKHLGEGHGNGGQGHGPGGTK